MISVVDRVLRILKGVLVVGAFALACPSQVMGAAPLEGIGSSSTGVSFGGGTTCAVTRVMVAGEDWAKPANNLGVFNLMFCPTNDYLHTRTVCPMSARSVRAEPLPDGERVIWEKFGEWSPLESAWMTVRSEGGKTRWRLGWKVKPGWALFYAAFPRLMLKGNVGPGDRLMWGGAESGVVHEPSNATRNPKPVLVNNRQPCQLAAQFFCRYTDSRLFYFACEDGKGWDKGIVCTRSKDGSIHPYWTHRGWWEGEGRLDYDVVTAATLQRQGEPCDWYDAADLYRAWAERQRWCAKTLLERDDLADFYRSAPYAMNMNRSWLDKPEMVDSFLSALRSDGLDGAPAIATVVGWEKWWEWVGPDYYPTYPSDTALRGVLGKLRANGVRPFLWPSTYNYALRWRMPDYVSGKRTKASDPWDFDHTAAFLAEGLDRIATIDEHGVWTNTAAWMGTGGTMATLCMAAPETKDWFVRTSVTPLVERGATLLQMDQFNMCCFRMCWSRSHGHSPHTGLWKTEGARANMAYAVAAMRKSEPESSVAFEGPNEQLLDLVAVQDTRDCRFFCGTWANAFTYLYHGYVLPFQAGIHPNRYWYAKAAAEGQMPRMLSSLAAYDEHGAFRDPFWHSFCVGWARLYRGEGKPYLAYGRHVRPPRIDCTRIRYKDMWRGRKIDMDVPAVFHAQYQAADGSRRVALVNATDDTQRGALIFRSGRRQEFEIGPRELRLADGE